MNKSIIITIDLQQKTSKNQANFILDQCANIARSLEGKTREVSNIEVKPSWSMLA